MTALTAEALVWRRPPAVDRRFAGILLGSLALHALVAVLLRQPEELPPPAPLQVTLRLAATVQPAAPAIPATPPSAEPPAPAPRAATAVPPKARQSVTREEPRPAARADVSAGPTVAAAPTAPAADSVAASAPATAPAPVAAAKPVAAPTPDPAVEALSAYRHQLTELFARPHEYPRIAAMRGWEGEVRLRLKVARKGNLLGVQLDRSSGFEVLDRDALALLEGYGKLPPLPEALDSNEISVVVPISYKLRKTT